MNARTDIILPPHGTAPMKRGDGPGPLTCMVCGAPTLWGTLSEYGARCRSCFVAYCVEPPNYQRVPADAIPVLPEHPRAWAYRLRWREQQGERLSRVEREAWRIGLPTEQAEREPGEEG